MSEQKVGIEGSKKVLQLIAKAVVLGVEIAKDGVGVEDLQHVPELISIAQEVIAVVKSEVGVDDELKDLDAGEVIVLIQLAVKEFQEVKDALGNKASPDLA